MREPDFPEPGKRGPRIDAERVRANREMGKALRAIGAVRTFYVVLAILAGLIAVVLLLASVPHKPRGFEIRLAIAVGMAAVLAIGAFRIGKEPLLWSVVIAVVWSIQVLVSLFIPPHITIWKIIYMVLAGGCWAAVMTIRPAMALMRKYPDLRSARRLRGNRARRR